MRSHFLRVAAIVAFVATCQSFAFNHPEIDWRTVSTANFLIHYYDRTEPAVYATYKIAEEEYAALSAIYTYRPKSKINISLVDYDDFSNGFAAWTEDNITIWVPDSRFDLRSNTTWLRDVITHELAHIMSLSKKGPQLFDFSLSTSYTSPSVAVQTQSPLALAQFVPDWFAEGTAQRESERAGDDCWDARRDMVLRCATLDGTMLSLDAMSSFYHDGLGDEMVYNQGFSFVKFLESRFGEQTMASIWNSSRTMTFAGKNFRRLFEQNAKFPLDAAYAAWADSLKAHYGASIPKVPTAATPVWTSGTFNDQPRVSVNGAWWGWLTSDKDAFSRTDLVVARYGESEPTARIKYARSSWCFSEDAATVYFIKARTPDRNGSLYNDIYAYDMSTGVETRITRGARVYDIAASADPHTLFCIRYDKGAFSIGKCNTRSGSLSTVVQGALGEPFMGLSPSPFEPARLATARVVNGKADIFTVNTDAQKPVLEPLCQTLAQEESPFWGTDGRVYYSADYDGVFNVYSVKQDGTDRRRHTRVRGGAFSPTLAKDGLLVASDYSSNGFSIVKYAATSDSFVVPNAAQCAFEPVPVPKGKVRIKSREYERRKLKAVLELHASVDVVDDSSFVPRAIGGEGVRAIYDSLGIMGSLGFTRYRSDALGKSIRALDVSAVYIRQALMVPDSVANASDNLAAAAPRLLAAQSRSLARSARVSPWASQFLRRRVTPVAGMRAAAAATSADSSDSARIVQSLVLIQPTLSLQNNSLKPSVGVEATGALYYLVVPVAAQIVSYASWHVLRDMYVDVMPVVSWTLGQDYPTVQVPVSLSWSTYGYLDEDMSYNMRGVSFAGVTLDPILFPGQGLFVVGAAGRYFPLGKHLSLLERFEATPLWLNGQYGDMQGVLPGYSDFYMAMGNTLKLTFPIFRNINSGGWCFLDNLYGSIFYDAQFYSDREPYAHPAQAYFTQADYDTAHAVVTHEIGAEAMLGVTKAYVFSRTLSLRLGYDILRQQVNFKARFGF